MPLDNTYKKRHVYVQERHLHALHFTTGFTIIKKD